MKFFAVFVALLSVAFGHQASWTLSQLSHAIESPSTDPAVLPYLEQALNEMMASLHAGEQIYTVTVTIPALDLSSWSLSQLSEAIENPNTDPALLPYLENALNQMMVAIVAGQPVGAAAASVVVPSMQVTLWSLRDLSEALENPATNPALVPYLEHALNDIMDALFAGQNMESIIVVIPVGLLPVENPISPMPVVPTPVEVPIVPTPVESPASPSSPLVQIIVNVNKGAAVAPAPVITPEPVIVVEQPEIVPEPVIIVDGPSVVPEPVIIVDGPSVVPEPVIVVENPTLVPEPVVIGTPVLPNPVDLLHPVGVVNPVGAGAGVVGPIV